MTDSKKRWKSKVALVTGATTGIGEAVAYALAGMGLTVVLAGRRAERLQDVSKNIHAKGGKALPVVCDIGDEKAILAMFETIKREIGTLDILVNNAGIGYNTTIAGFNTSEFSGVFNVNVIGTSICIREALKMLGSRPDTAIISISSLAAHRIPRGGYGVYSASKHALRAIMEALRTELVGLSSATKVASISPGTVATEFHKLFSRSDTDPTEGLSFERLQSQDIADVVVYMLSTPSHVQIDDVFIRPIGQLG